MERFSTYQEQKCREYVCGVEQIMLFTYKSCYINYTSGTNDTKAILEKPTMKISRGVAALAKSEVMKTQSRCAGDTCRVG